MFCLQLLIVCCRYILLNPKEQFVFYDEKTLPGIYKFIYDSREKCHLEIFDPLGHKTLDSHHQSGAFYINMTSPGLIKIIMSNLSDKQCKFSYKAPDPSKELTGYLGYVEETDMVAELAEILDKLIDQQKYHIENAYNHYELVKNSKKWVRFMIVFELILTALAVYFIHQNFISMFETKKKI
ncbi:ATPase of the PP-loop superfamily, predicted [Enterocytozoon bieneusi H348]|nr:ATPase of the PP-loop superfamily, predicted [Enterocytozoon bieneusi H348]|eukprot:XP_002649946.1 ATPase of the PP-loop superfamily, predicted [Enterocytozoon bieneusi H348]